MDFDGLPLVIGWELTLRCNLRCRHCASSAALPRRNELTLEESLRIADQFPALLVQEVDFTGGEPLLHPHWDRIAARVSGHGIAAQMLTNGWRIDYGTLRRMRDSGISAIGVSVDGLERTHDSIRDCPGLFRRVLAGIELALAADFPMTVITTVNARNLPELPELFQRLCSIGVPHWQIQPMFPLGRAGGAPDLELTPADYQQLGRFVRDWTPKGERAGLQMKPSDTYGYYTELDTRETPWRGCPAGRVSCGITSDGKIKGCLSLPDEFIEGDLRQRDLWDIWFQPEAFPYSRGFSVDQMGPNCQGCDLAEVCRGGCSAMSFGNTRRFQNNPLCFHGIHQRQLSGGSARMKLGIVNSGTGF